MRNLRSYSRSFDRPLQSPPVNKQHLDNLTRGSKPSLHRIETDWDVLRGLIQRGAESLEDARNERNSLATPFAAAYSAAFWLARVALEARGYRLAGAEGHRTTLFQSLAHTLDWEAARWRSLDDLHRFRNRFDYGDVVEIPEHEVDRAIAGAQDLLNDILQGFSRSEPLTRRRHRRPSGGGPG